MNPIKQERNNDVYQTHATIYSTLYICIEEYRVREYSYYELTIIIIVLMMFVNIIKL